MSVDGTIEVCLARTDDTVEVGRLHRHPGRRGESVTFEYAETWLADPERFAIDPSTPLGAGVFAPTRERALLAAIGDTTPDSWGRRLMQRAERRAATREGRRVRTPGEMDYLLGVSDATRLGALRFRPPGSETFRAPAPDGVPPMIALGRLLDSTRRILRDEATDADLALVLAPGSSLGGARPKASVLDVHGQLSIAKFPKESRAAVRSRDRPGRRYHRRGRARDASLARRRPRARRTAEGDRTHGQRVRARRSGGGARARLVAPPYPHCGKNIARYLRLALREIEREGTIAKIRAA